MKTRSVIRCLSYLVFYLLINATLEGIETADFEAAVQRYRDRIRQDPENLTLHREMIRHAHQTDRLDIPLHIYKAASEKQPESPVASYVLGYTYLVQASESSLLEAEGLLQAAIAKQPNLADGYAALGECYVMQQKTGAAIESLQKSIQLDSNLWEAHLALGRAYRQIGNLEAARRAFSQTIKHHPKSADAHYQLGQISALEQKGDEALSHYRKGREFDPNNAEARYQLAHIFLDTDDEGNAILALRSALAVNEAYAGYVETLKDANLAQAADVITQILDKQPKQAPLQHFAGELFLKLNQPEKAREHFQQALAINPTNARAQFGLGQTYESDAPDVAIEAYKRAVEGGNTDIELLLKVVRNYLRNRELDQFFKLAHRILELDANQPEIHYQLANFYDEQSYWEKQAGETEASTKLFDFAIQHATKAIELAPTVAKYHVKLGALYDQLDQLNALDFYERAIAVDPQYADAYYRRGALISDYVFGREGPLRYRPESAILDLQKAVQLAPDMAVAHYALGVTFDRIGDVKNAMISFQRAAELDTNDPRPLLYLAEKYASRGQPLRAIAIFAQAIQVNPKNVEALKDYAFLSLNHDKENGKNRAKEALEKVLQISPQDPDALKGWESMRE